MIIIRMMICRILSVRHHCDESRAVSCFMMMMMMMWKHPVMIRMMRLYNEEILYNCDVIDAVRVSSGLCQIIAA